MVLGKNPKTGGHQHAFGLLAWDPFIVAFLLHFNYFYTGLINNFDSILMDPNNVEPICMGGHRHWNQSPWFMRGVTIGDEGANELLIVVASVMSVKSKVSPFHEDVRHKLPGRLVQYFRLQCLQM